MLSVTREWNPKQALLKEIILCPDRFDEAIALCASMHALVHSSQMSHTGFGTIEDSLWKGLEEAAFRLMPAAGDVTIAWNLWHITRIEDITANILIADDKQVLNCDDWLSKMNVSVTDTGNAMNDEEILDLSQKINIEALKSYRMAVGRKTQKILKDLKPADLKRKFAKPQLMRIKDEGGLLESPDSIWLLDFWGRKNVAGLLLMPITRHQIVHLNDSLRIKGKVLAKQGNRPAKG